MARLALILVIPALLLMSGAHAAALKLRDGTVVRGTIVKLEDGVYHVDSTTLGQIKVRQADVETVQYGRSQAGENANASAQIRQIQLDLASDGSIMSMITALQDNPQLKEILADPELMRAVNSGDLATLMASEKFMALLSQPDIKAITRKATGQ